MASAVDWVLLDETGLQVGDLVSADAGGMPTYRVMAVEDDRAFVRDNSHDCLFVRPLSAFHWKAAS